MKLKRYCRRAFEKRSKSGIRVAKTAGRFRWASGFTLIELLVVIALIAILASLAGPSFNDLILKNRLSSMASDFVGSTQLARSEAIKRNVTVTLCQSANGTSCATSGGWQQGWIVLQGTAVLQKHDALSGGFLMFDADGTGSIDFPSIGISSRLDDIILTLCRSSPSIGNIKQTITVPVNGYAKKKEEPSTTCASP